MVGPHHHHPPSHTNQWIHRLFPYMVVTSSLGVFFIFLLLTLAAQRFLLPGIVLVGSFVLFVLWLTGLVETSLQLFGVVANIDDQCQIYVVDNVATGNSFVTLAWLLQSAICMSTPLRSSGWGEWLVEGGWANHGWQVIAGKRRLRSSWSIRCFLSG